MLEGTGFGPPARPAACTASSGPLRRGAGATPEFMSNIIGVDTDIFDSQIPAG